MKIRIDASKVEAKMEKVKSKLMVCGVFFGVLLLGLCVLIGMWLGGFFTDTSETTNSGVGNWVEVECEEVDYRLARRRVRLDEEFRLGVCETVRVEGASTRDVWVTLRAEEMLPCRGEGCLRMRAELSMNIEHRDNTGISYEAEVVRSGEDYAAVIVGRVMPDGVVLYGESVVLELDGQSETMADSEGRMIMVRAYDCGDSVGYVYQTLQWRGMVLGERVMVCDDSGPLEVLETDGVNEIEVVMRDER